MLTNTLKQRGKLARLMRTFCHVWSCPSWMCENQQISNSRVIVSHWHTSCNHRPVVSLSNILNLLDRFELFVADLTRVGNASAFCILYVEYGWNCLLYFIITLFCYLTRIIMACAFLTTRYSALRRAWLCYCKSSVILSICDVGVPWWHSFEFCWK